MGELEFQQRWEFRRNEDKDLDSSSDDSKSSSGQLLIKKHKLVSSLIPVGDDDHETSETCRLKLKDNDNPGTGGHINIGKVKKRKTRNISNNLQNSKLKRDSPEKVDLQKDETIAHDPAPLDDLKNFMESLLKDLKVTREDLLKWMLEEMQKLVADDTTTPVPKRRKRCHGGEKVQLKQMKKSKKVQDQYEKPQKESMQFQHPNNSEKSIRVQHRTNFQEPVLAQQQNNFQVQLQEQENINKQHQNEFKYGMITQNCNNISSVRFPSTDYFNALGDRVDSEQVTEFITSSKKNKGVHSLSISANPNLQTSPDQNVQLQSHNKSVVLAIEAQKGKGGSLKRSAAKGKKTVESYRSDHHQVPEDQGGTHSQAMTTSVIGTNGENFLSSPSCQPPSSTYLTLPTVLTEPIVANHGLDPSLCNYILPRVVNSEKVYQMLEPSSNQGSFPVIQPEERIIRSFAQMGSRNIMGSFNQNSPPISGIGTRFPVPLHQGIDVVGSSITSKPLGLRMNGGGAIKFSGGSYNLSEVHIASNNHHSHPAYKYDGSLMSYQMQNIKDGHLSLQ